MATHSKTVTISTNARLHFGFFDLSGASSRRYGSLGLAISAFQTCIQLSWGEPDPALDAWTADRLSVQKKALNITEDVSVQVIQAIPRHSGLGSGTQMALALGAGLQSLIGQSIDPQLLALHGGRGGRSGIGLSSFLHGGLIIDGGRGQDTVLPPMLMRHNFPEDWCFLLIMDHNQTGVHGQVETTAFQQLNPMPLARTHALSHQILMQALPALHEQDFKTFADSLGILQDYNATYFSPAQGGPYASASVTRVIEALKAQGHIAVGQSSWGPTGFVMLPDLSQAQLLKQLLQAQFAAEGLEFVISGATNHGAQIQISDAI